MESEVNKGTRFLLTFPPVVDVEPDEQLVQSGGEAGASDKETQ